MDKGEGPKRMISLDFMNPSDYLQLLQQSQLLLNTSISEGTCSSILEAFLYGVPVLVRDNHGNKELVQDSINGYTFSDNQEF